MRWRVHSAISIQTTATTLALLASLLSPAQAFSFSYSPPTQCGNFTIQWQGGTAPFKLQITPPFNTPRYYDIPASAFSNGKGSYSFPLPLNTSSTFLATMSDATGFGTGGTSDLLTVGGPDDTSCNLIGPPVDFIYITPNALVQCRPYIFNGYTQAQGALTVTGLIPLGNSFTLKPPPGSTSYSWTANVKSGTRLVFVITDSAGRQGGATDLLFVGASDTTSCITPDSPASTAQSQTLVPTATNSASATASPGAGESSNGGVIAGAVIGGILGLIAIVALVWFFLRRRRQKSETPHISTHFGKRRSGAVDLMPEEADYSLPRGGNDGTHNYEPVPFMLPDSHSNNGHGTSAPSQGPGTTYTGSVSGDYPPIHPGSGWNNSRNSTYTDGNGPGYAITSSQGRSSKQALAFANTGGQAPNTPARFVLHTDAGEVPDLPNDEEEEEVVELPPQYSSLTPAQRRESIRQAQAQRRASGSGQPGRSS